MKKFKRQLKGLLYRIGIHRFLPVRLFDYLGHLGKASMWLNQQKDVPFSSFPTTDIVYKNRLNLFQYVIDSQNLSDTPVDYLEFGVHAAKSFKWWLGNLNHEQCRFYGFDTFTGLPEAWGPFPKGHFGGVEVPKLDDNRCEFKVGLFQQTLIPFLQSYSSNKRKIIHIDADLYSSTLYVLTLITPYLNSEDIILFDEFNVPVHEIKAFMEWTESFYIKYEVLGEVNNYFQVAFKII